MSGLSAWRATRVQRTLLVPALVVAAGVLASGAGVLAGGAGAAASTTPPGRALPVAFGRPAALPTPTPPGAAGEQQQQKEPPPVPSSPGTSPLQRGRQLFGAGCAGCHGQQGGGSPRGPSLLGVGPASVDWWVSSGRMPLSDPIPEPERKPPAYSSDDTDALVAYVTSLAPGGPPIPKLPAGNLQSGGQLYLTNCAACHGSSAVGAALPAGRVAPNLLGVPDIQVAEAVRLGPGLMPAFPPSALSDQQLANIVTYLGELPTHESHGGFSIGAIGPVTEGVVGWVIGLGLLVVVIRLLGKRAPS